MKHSANLPVRDLLVVPALLLPVGTSWAALDEFTPYAFARVLYDSNVFRLSGDQEAIARLGDSSRDDTIGHLGAGMRADWKLSRQHLLLDAEVDQAKYDNFSDLDHTRIDGKGVWKWEVGNLWSGDLGYRYQKRLRSFNEDKTPEKDMRTEHRGFFDAGYQIHPDWRLVGAVTHSDVSYQKRERLDRTADTGLFEVQYRNTRNTRVGIRATYTANDLRNTVDVAGVSINNDYDETELSGVFYWEATGKSDLEARLGYTDVKYDELDDRDFQGTTGRLTHGWAFSAKTKVDTSVWRETSSLDDEIASYVLEKGISIAPSWSATSKITIKGLVSYTNDDYKGENDARAALGLERRDDDTWLYIIGADYDPTQNLKLSVSYRRENRDSSINVNDFDDHQVDAKAQLQF